MRMALQNKAILGCFDIERGLFREIEPNDELVLVLFLDSMRDAEYPLLIFCCYEDVHMKLLSR